MRQPHLLLAAFSMAISFNVLAQTAFTGAESRYVDNLSDSEFFGSSVPEDSERFWTTRTFAITYSYSWADQRRSIEEDFHQFVPELYLESSSGWILNLAGLYSHHDLESKAFLRDEIDEDAYGISVQPAYDLLKSWMPEDRPEMMNRSRLIAGLDMNYIRVESDGKSLIAKFESETDIFVLSPNLVFVQPISENFTAFLIPAFTMSWSDTRFNGSSSNAKYGLLSLAGRGDYRVCDGLVVSGFATWKRDVKWNAVRRANDWAEFGGQLRVALTDSISLRAGYSYEAFIENYKAHHCFLSLQRGF